MHCNSMAVHSFMYAVGSFLYYPVMIIGFVIKFVYKFGFLLALFLMPLAAWQVAAPTDTFFSYLNHALSGGNATRFIFGILLSAVMIWLVFMFLFKVVVLNLAEFVSLMRKGNRQMIDRSHRLSRSLSPSAMKKEMDDFRSSSLYSDAMVYYKDASDSYM